MSVRQTFFSLLLLLPFSAGCRAPEKGVNQHHKGDTMSALPANWTLYIGQGCPYCKRVTDFIEQNNLTIATVDVWKDKAASDQVYDWTQRRTVPYLRMGDNGMHESLDIIERIKKEAGLTSA